MAKRAAAKPVPLRPLAFRRALAAWFQANARALPWRATNEPYPIWVSEIMLQQTRVAAVLDHYKTFLSRFPTLVSLALADEQDVLAAWSGLGYYRRARMLHQAAQFVVRELGGKLPTTSAALRTLPGIGEYTAAAIASIAFGEAVPVLDGNVERVLLRLLGHPEHTSNSERTKLLRKAADLMPSSTSSPAPGDHNQAMMELGATVCLPQNPLCGECPAWKFCLTRGQHLTSARPKMRSQEVAYLLATRKKGTATQVLLRKRPATEALMPQMWELPEAPLDAVEGQPALLRVRHSITNTNYYVRVHAADQSTAPSPLPNQSGPGKGGTVWIQSTRLASMPLTGLARKILQRLDLMALPTPDFSGNADPVAEEDEFPPERETDPRFRRV